MNKPFAIGAIGILFILVAVVWFSGMGNSNPAGNESLTSLETLTFTSEMNEQVQLEVFVDGTAVLRGSEYNDVRLSKVTSGLDERYVSADQLVDVRLLNDTITILVNAAVVYTGTSPDVFEQAESVEEPSPTPTLPTPPPTTSLPIPIPVPTVTGLTSKTWYWVSTEVGGVLTTPNKPSRFTLEFKSDGNLTGTTDCNNYGGAYEVKADMITFGAFFQTKMGCLDTQESEYLQHFTQTMILSLGETELKLTNTSRDTVIRLTSQRPVANACYVGGCSGQICSEDANVVTTCEFRPEYACYQDATCERQVNGECGWTETPALTKCLAEGLTS